VYHPRVADRRANAVTILSANLGVRRTLEVGGRLMETGFFKVPIRESTAFVTSSGLVGDFRTSARSSPEQALYAYPSEHYSTYERDLGRPLPPGSFGENLTVAGLAEADLRIGDVLSGREVALQITGPRTPCKKLNAALNARISGTFLERAQVGYYMRVLSGGRLTLGEELLVAESDPASPTLREFVEDALLEFWDARGLERCLGARGLSPIWRETLESRLARASRASSWPGPRLFVVRGARGSDPVQLDVACARGRELPPVVHTRQVTLMYRPAPLEPVRRYPSVPGSLELHCADFGARGDFYRMVFADLPSAAWRSGRVRLAASQSSVPQRSE
jgi:MOSC domain-containing protein YiiM